MCMDGQFFQPGTLQYDITLPTPTKTKMAALRIWTNVQSWRSSLRPRNSVTCASRAPEVSPIIVSPVSCPRKSCYFTNTNMAVASDRKEKVWPYWQLELRENYISVMGFCECWTRPDLCDCWCSLFHHALILQCSLLRQTTTFSSWKMIF